MASAREKGKRQSQKKKKGTLFFCRFSMRVWYKKRRGEGGGGQPSREKKKGKVRKRWLL